MCAAEGSVKAEGAGGIFILDYVDDVTAQTRGCGCQM